MSLEGEAVAEGAVTNPTADHVRALTSRAAEVFGACKRDDLARQARIAEARVVRPGTIVCVVGEFKHGKSSLVNGMLGRTVCPVADDEATAVITVVHHADEVCVVARRPGEDGKEIATPVDPAHLEQVVTERGNRRNRLHLDRVDIGVPNALLAQGVTLVDTPGAGGVDGAHAAAVLSFLPFADALVFVSDAGAELTAAEIEFLRTALDVCPQVLYCLSKIDLYPEWRRIAELDQHHLAHAGLDLTPIPVSSALRLVAVKEQSRVLNDESGFPRLLATLDEAAIRPAKRIAARRAVTTVAASAQQLLAVARAEDAALRDPATMASTLAELQAEKERLDFLRGPGARWSTVLADQVADLGNNVTHRFRTGMRGALRAADAELEAAGNAAAWDETATRLQAAAAQTVLDAFEQVRDGASAIGEAVAAALAEEHVAAPAAPESSPFDVTSLWGERGFGQGSSNLDGAVTFIGGVQSGMYTMTTLSRLMPAAAAGVVLANPVVIGAGLLMGGQRLLDTRKRQVAMQRQQARTALRQFVDDVQFEVGNQLAEAVRVVQRNLRDHFSERVTEQLRTLTDATQRLQEHARRNQAERESRLESLAGVITALDQLVGAAERLRPSLPA